MTSPLSVVLKMSGLSQEFGVARFVLPFFSRPYVEAILCLWDFLPFCFFLRRCRDFPVSALWGRTTSGQAKRYAGAACVALIGYDRSMLSLEATKLGTESDGHCLVRMDMEPWAPGRRHLGGAKHHCDRLANGILYDRCYAYFL